MTCCNCRARIDRTNMSVYIIGGDKPLCPDCLKSWGEAQDKAWKEWRDD